MVNKLVKSAESVKISGEKHANDTNQNTSLISIGINIFLYLALFTQHEKGYINAPIPATMLLDYLKGLKDR